jgi:hypothetical protein
MKNEEMKSTTSPLRLIVKIAIAMTSINTWILFEEIVVDRHGLWRYMPFYRVGLFCAWDFSVLTVILLVVLLSVAPLRRAVWRVIRKVCFLGGCKLCQ